MTFACTIFIIVIIISYTNPSGSTVPDAPGRLDFKHQIVPFEFFVEKWIYQVDKFESTWDSGNLVSTAITYVRLPVLVALYFPAARPVAVARFSGCFLPVYFSGTLHRTENYSFLRDTFQHRLEQLVCSCVFCEIRLFLLWAATL